MGMETIMHESSASEDAFYSNADIFTAQAAKKNRPVTYFKSNSRDIETFSSTIFDIWDGNGDSLYIHQMWTDVCIRGNEWE